MIYNIFVFFLILLISSLFFAQFYIMNKWFPYGIPIVNKFFNFVYKYFSLFYSYIFNN